MKLIYIKRVIILLLAWFITYSLINMAVNWNKKAHNGEDEYKKELDKPVISDF